MCPKHCIRTFLGRCEGELLIVLLVVASLAFIWRRRPLAYLERITCDTDKSQLMPNTRRGAVSKKRRQLQCGAPQTFQRVGAFDENCILPNFESTVKTTRFVAHSACISVFKTTKCHMLVLHVVNRRLV